MPNRRLLVIWLGVLVGLALAQPPAPATAIGRPALCRAARERPPARRRRSVSSALLLRIADDHARLAPSNQGDDVSHLGHPGILPTFPTLHFPGAGAATSLGVLASVQTTRLPRYLLHCAWLL